MNRLIIDNLFSFWMFVGSRTDNLIVAEGYKSVFVNGSDWPNRIFDVDENDCDVNEIIKLSHQCALPDNITLTFNDKAVSDSRMKLFLQQSNMALDMKNYSSVVYEDNMVQQVVSEDDSVMFADVASKSFGYRVDSRIVYKLVYSFSPVKMFVYREFDKCLGCGLVFFDAKNTAGLHMIGTLPESRGLGVAKKITARLLDEVILSKCKICVLNASSMGEFVYRKFGFQSYGLLGTYKILK